MQVVWRTLNEKNRLVSCVMVLTMLIISSLGNIEGKSTSYAQEKNNLTIKEVKRKPNTYIG
ncbi:hypothetical protein Q5M85_11890 [Paraclostridium bifermentans]|nr:hypothetical protein [Paraclostridium bifermentans]